MRWLRTGESPNGLSERDGTGASPLEANDQREQGIGYTRGLNIDELRDPFRKCFTPGISK